ncbi:MAG: hypothetical protein Q4P06_06110 [Actinomycetaceae bacterium]|nr:hypothetical protein [Actinomycetaceae bacterium]
MNKPTPLAAALTSAASAFVVTTAVNTFLRSAPSLKLRNHQGKAVSLSEGAAVATSLTTSALARQNWAGGVALGITSAVGMADDLDQGRHDGEAPAKGLKGHLRALSRGKISTGMVKMVGIGAAALIYNAGKRGERERNLVDLAVDTVLVAGSANLANLFDLRPGRALKTSAVPVVFAAALSSQARPAALATTVTALAAAPSDLRGETMLGDAGANPLGLQCGMMLTCIHSRALRTALAAATTGLILASEKVSFTEVIAANPLLNAIDQAGRKQT